MRKQIVVVGLGQFGMAVAQSLAQRAVEVLAVDTDPERVRTAASFVDEAICLDATNEEALASISPSRRDVCVCAIGERHREASIICTALLRQLGARRVVTRANDEVHVRILRLVGAHQVVNPEREYGQGFSTQLLYQGVKGELRLGPGVLVTEAIAPAPLVGRTLAELSLPRSFGVTVVLVRREADERVQLPTPSTVIAEGDVLVMVAADAAVEKMLDSLG